MPKSSYSLVQPKEDTLSSKLATQYCIISYIYRPKNMENLKCYEPDEPPVSVGEIFENDCSDKSGVHFEENSTLSSCCNCLM